MHSFCVRSMLLGLALIPGLVRGGPVAGQLSGTVETLPQLARYQAPIPVQCRLIWTGSELIEGQILISVVDDSSPVFDYRTGPIVLQPGERTIDLLLPNYRMRRHTPEVTIRLYWLNTGRNVPQSGKRADTKKKEDPELDDPTSQEERGPVVEENQQVLELGEMILRVANGSRCSFVIGTIDHSIENPPRERLLLEQALELPVAESLEWVTVVDRRTKVRWPRSPYGLLAFDLVLLVEENWTSLPVERLAELEDWLRAGGSALIVCSRTVPASHARWLRDLLEKEKLNGGWEFDSEGKPISKSDVLHFEVGLGTLALMNSYLSDEKFKSPEWRTTLSFLWKTSKKASTELIDEGLLGSSEDLVGFHFSLREDPSSLGWIKNKLLPGDIEEVPIGLVRLVIVIYLLVLIPFEALILRKSGRKSWTWISFPAIAILVTLLLTAITNAYLFNKTEQRRLTVIDIVSGNRAVRSNEFLLTFPNRTRDVQIEQDRGTLQFVEDIRDQNYRDPFSGAVPLFQGHPAIEGQLNYSGQQWSPVLTRSFIFGSRTPVPDFNWDELETLDPIENEAKIREKLISYFGRDIVIGIMTHQGTIYPLPQKDEKSVTGIRYSERFDQELTRQNHPLLDFFSRPSPSGGFQLIDCSLTDQSDPSLWVLTVWLPNRNELAQEESNNNLPASTGEENQDFILYRRLYRTSDQ